jgi:hypothetical protein
MSLAGCELGMGASKDNVRNHCTDVSREQQIIVLFPFTHSLYVRTANDKLNLSQNLRHRSASCVGLWEETHSSCSTHTLN